MQTREKNGRQNKYKYSDFCARARRKSPLCDRHWPKLEKFGIYTILYTAAVAAEPRKNDRKKTI